MEILNSEMEILNCDGFIGNILKNIFSFLNNHFQVKNDFIWVFEIQNSKSVDFKAFIYEVNTVYFWTMRIANYVLCKGLKIYNRNMLTRSSQRIFNPMRCTGIDK